ncbi:MAG TPA: hypothetical protein VE912_03730 [Bacteroidales bacterium]|nr:hypothetical protein [Bacteroidales bacterium]
MIELCAEKQGSKDEGLLKAAELCGNVPAFVINTRPLETLRGRMNHSEALKSV